MPHEAIDLELCHNIEFAHAATLRERGERLLRLAQVAFSSIQIVLICNHDERFVLLFLLFRFGFAAPRVLRRAHQSFDVSYIVFVLPPVAQTMPVAPLRGERDDFAHRVVQQADVGREVYIRLNHKGVAPPTQGFVGFFFTRT